MRRIGRLSSRIHDSSPPSTPIAFCAFLISSITAMASAGRSEEHTSELQSLMRISYAVFCLKKKKQPDFNSAKSTAAAIHNVDRHITQHTRGVYMQYN